MDPVLTEESIKKSPLTIGVWMAVMGVLAAALLLGIRTQASINKACAESTGHHENKETLKAHSGLSHHFPTRSESAGRWAGFDRKLDALILQGKQNIEDHRGFKFRLDQIELVMPRPRRPRRRRRAP